MLQLTSSKMPNTTSQQWCLQGQQLFTPRKLIQDSLGFWIPLCWFQITGTGFRFFCQWKMDSELQSVVGFRIPWAGFQIPKPRIPNSTIKKISRIPHPTSNNSFSSGIRILLRRKLERFRITISLKLSRSSWKSPKLRTKDLETPGS